MGVKFDIEVEKPEEEVISVLDMDPLDIGIVVEGVNSMYLGHIVMRTASVDDREIMDLTRATKDGCWTTFSTKTSIKVKLFPAGTKITLTVKEKPKNVPY